jgi:HSP20 family molecular chaperone IbpA
MRGTNVEMMHDHVRAIHRAVTGEDPPAPSPPAADAAPVTRERVAQHFAELEAIARSLPAIAARVPPFSFTPPIDVIGTETELILELGIPGVGGEDVDIEQEGDSLIISGARPTDVALDGRIYFLAEMPRGPFRRQIRLPLPTSGAPRLEVDKGVVRVRLTKATRSPLPRA